jgi:tRNA-dihydrouridine synthase B
MAGMTDTAFRRLVKREGGCGLVVTEMVSSEGLVRGIDRTLEYAEYTEEERPVSIQIFGGDPEKMAAAAQIVEGMGADIVDVNMGCPVPKIAKHNAGCSLMREPEHAAGHAAMVGGAIPVIRRCAGWNEQFRPRPRSRWSMPALQRLFTGAPARVLRRLGLGLIARGRAEHPCARQRTASSLSRSSSGSRARVGRSSGAACSGTLILAQAPTGPRPPARRSAGRPGTVPARLSTCCWRTHDEPEGFRHTAPRAFLRLPAAERWVINKLRALNAWYSKGIEHGSRLRTATNQCESIPALRGLIEEFFFEGAHALAGAGLGTMTRNTPTSLE